jgi:NAD(P)-dependent dehydrogenase (short-subunit alcohol dehydrogenase family)
MSNVSGKTALVTGASRGIGRASGNALLDAGKLLARTRQVRFSRDTRIGFAVGPRQSRCRLALSCPLMVSSNHGSAAAADLATGFHDDSQSPPCSVDDARRPLAKWPRSVGASTSAERAAPTTLDSGLLLSTSLFCLMRAQANERGLS